MSLLAWVALLLAAVAAAATLFWIFSDAQAAQEWGPNVAVEAASIAVVITLIDWIVKRAARQRIAPRLDRALGSLASKSSYYVEAIAWDYAATHVYSFRELPHETLQMLDLWLAEQDSEDSPRPKVSEGTPPIVLTAAVSLSESLEAARDRDLDVLEPDLVAAMDSFVASTRRGDVLYRLSARENDQASVNAALRHVVAGARRLGEALVRHYAPAGHLREDTRESATALHEKILKKATAAASGATPGAMQYAETDRDPETGEGAGTAR